MRLRLLGAGSTLTLALLAAICAFVAATRGSVELGSVPASVPALQLDFALTPLAAPFLALLAMLGSAVGVWGLRRDRPIDAMLIAAFVAAMLVLLIASSVASFFLSWETMSLVSAFLVAAYHKRRAVRRATWVYLVAAQAGALCILATMLVLATHAGGWSFPAIATAAATLPPSARDAAFILAMLGFGSKAGLLPLHFWLPRAHPVAPPSASAMLSGAMLKVALYALTLVTFNLAAPAPTSWGVALMVVGTLSAIGGVLYALVDHDLKRLLAYHSVENVGIIAIGIGLALVARSTGDLALAALALTAAIFHAINHGLFKGLLFLGSGVVADTEGTVDLERLGGLWSHLVWTGPLFLIGCVAIVGLPPFNGFASEWMTFQSLIASWHAFVPAFALVSLAAVLGLSLTGGLAAACFVKVFGVAFLGHPRRAVTRPIATERFDAATLALMALAVLCTLFGIVPMLVVVPLARVVASTIGVAPPIAAALPVLPIALATLPIAAAIGVLAIERYRRVRTVPTWTCGSPVTPSAQYTATAFSKSLRTIFAFVLLPERRRIVEAGASSWFPKRIVYRTESRDIIDETARRFAALMLQFARRSRALQSGSLRLYVAYSLGAVIVAIALANR